LQIGTFLYQRRAPIRAHDARRTTLRSARSVVAFELLREWSNRADVRVTTSVTLRQALQTDEPISRAGAVCQPTAIMSKRLPQVCLSLVAGASRRDASDAELAHALAAGEAWAIGVAWSRFAPMVLTLAERSLGSRSDAEDLAQDVFIDVFQSKKTLREPEKLRSFVYSVAIFALKTELRRRKLRGWLSFLTPEALVDLGSRSVDVESRDLLRRFYALLDRLPARDRLVFSLRELESMTVEEIAEVTDISVSTVKRSLARAMTRLSCWIMADADLADVFDTRRWQ